MLVRLHTKCNFEFPFRHLNARKNNPHKQRCVDTILGTFEIDTVCALHTRTPAFPKTKRPKVYLPSLLRAMHPQSVCEYDGVCVCVCVPSKIYIRLKV